MWKRLGVGLVLAAALVAEAAYHIARPVDDAAPAGAHLSAVGAGGAGERRRLPARSALAPELVAESSAFHGDHAASRAASALLQSGDVVAEAAVTEHGVVGSSTGTQARLRSTPGGAGVDGRSRSGKTEFVRACSTHLPDWCQYWTESIWHIEHSAVVPASPENERAPLVPGEDIRMADCHATDKTETRPKMITVQLVACADPDRAMTLESIFVMSEDMTQRLEFWDENFTDSLILVWQRSGTC